MSERCLVLGARGFLGCHTVTALRAGGYDVVGGSRDGADGTRACDVSDPRSVSALLDETRPAAIVNCAVVADFGSGALARQYAVNVLLPALCAGWCAANGGYLVQVSASLVQGARTPLIDAAAQVLPDTDYGRGKWLAEQAVEASGAQAVCLRFGGIYGADGPDHLHLNRSLRDALRGERPVLVGSGSARRNYAYVKDAAEVIVHCVRARPNGVRWYGGPETLSLAAFVEVVCAVLLNGVGPERRPGGEGGHQVIVPSDDLPKGRTLRAALEDMR